MKLEFLSITFAAVMEKHIHSVRDFLLSIIDFFYPPFRKIMNLQTFRYAACGSTNVLIGFAVYYISFKYIFQEKTFDFGFYALKAHVAALFISFCVNFCLGFLLMKFVVFVDSDIASRKQLFRYFMVCLFNLALNYILLKILVEYFHIYPIFAQTFTVVIVVITSYIAQRNFSFKISSPTEIRD